MAEAHRSPSSGQQPQRRPGAAKRQGLPVANTLCQQDRRLRPRHPAEADAQQQQPQQGGNYYYNFPFGW